MDESTPCANKEQGFIVKSKKKRKKSKNKGACNNTLTGKEFEPEKQPKERTTLLIGDSMISRIPGKDLGKAVGHRVIVKPFDTKVRLSELVCRKDKLGQAMKTANKHLKKFCHQNGWKLIHHENISHSGLNKGGLHLNFKGIEQFYNNFKSHLK